MTGFREVLEFWFGSGPGQSRREWFVKDAAFDEAIRSRFGDVQVAALAGRLAGWRDEPESLLALVIVLDQFSRNLFRNNDARAFAGDPHALASANLALARGDDRKLLPVQRQFLYMPFEHSEELADQDRAVELMHGLKAFEETRGLIEWAERHRVIVHRFGRFPHRNAVLGRTSTGEEARFLKGPGSSF